jgi:CheY-like chemotaxis protein
MHAVAEIAHTDARKRASEASSPRLLLIDQQPAFVSFARVVAQRMGYETSAVADPRDVPARITAWRPSVVVLEVVMPEVDGIEIIRLLVDLGFDGELIPVTAHNPAYLELARKTAEANGLRVATCLAKPVRTAAMATALQLCACR